MKMIEFSNKTNILLNDIDVDLLYLNIYFDVGFKDDVDFQIGAAHLAEHIISKSVIKNLNLIQSPFSWNNAYVSKEYTCLWHVIKKEDENRIVSYIKEYLSLIQNVNKYNLINIDGEKERFYAENDAILANTLLMNLLYIEYQLFTDGYSIPSFFCDTEENYFTKLKENSIHMLSDRYKNSRITIVITGKISSDILQSLTNMCVTRKVDDCEIINKVYENIKFPHYKKLCYIAYKICIYELEGSIYQLDILARFYQIISSNYTYRKVICNYQIKVIDNEILFAVFFYDKKGMDAFCSIDFNHALLSSVELIFSIKNELAFTLAKNLSDPFKMNFQIYKAYRDMHKLLNKMEVLQTVYNITENDLQCVHNLVRKNEALRYSE